MTPKQNLKFLNSYLRLMEPVIIKHHGFIDKYMGDAVMALFSGRADDAIQAGIEMLTQLKKYNEYRDTEGCVPIQIGVGIDSGSLILGTVGGYHRMDGTIISDVVHCASAIEKQTRNYEVSLLISLQTYSRLHNPSDYAIRLIDNNQSQPFYEVFEADTSDNKAGKLATLETFATALSLYEQKNYQKSAEQFEQCVNQNPLNTVADSYLTRCRTFG